MVGSTHHEKAPPEQEGLFVYAAGGRAAMRAVLPSVPQDTP
jgi:hypothetical protein